MVNVTTQDFFRDGVRDDVQYYRPLYNIEQVEILRGSDALTSGFGGAHGMVNRVSKKGVIGESFNIVKGSVDTFNETVFSLDNNYELGEDKALRSLICSETTSRIIVITTMAILLACNPTSEFKLKMERS